MAYPAAVIEVMLAAPDDLKKELLIMEEVVLAWNHANARARKVVLLPVSHTRQAVPEVGSPPQAIINQQLLEHCDLLVAAFWTRLGTPTETHASGTVEEIERHVAAGKPAMLYFSNARAETSDIDTRQLDAVRAYKDKMQGQALYREFDSPDDLRTKLSTNLAALMNGNAYISATLNWHSNLLAKSIDPERDLSALAKTMLIRATHGNGIIDRFMSIEGLEVGAGNEEFTTPGDPRSEAAAEAALEELVGAELVVDRVGEGRLFNVTQMGYDVGDSLPPSLTNS